MRRIGRVIAAAAAASFGLAVPASAIDHRMTVNEVATSLGASTANQFVELLDPADEPFPFPGYRLAVYDSAGVSVASQSLGSGMGVIDGGQPMLVAKGDVGATPHATLSINLPTTAGQACFERADGSRIHCLRWGTIVNPVGTIAMSGPAPGDGQSLQICGASARLGTPTPRAANTCTTTGGGPPPPPGDRTAPTAAARVPFQTLTEVRRRGLRVVVRSNEDGAVRARLLRRGRQVRATTATLRASRARTLRLTLPLALRRALRNADAATFSLRLRVTDAAGNARNLSRTARVRDYRALP